MTPYDTVDQNLSDVVCRRKVLSAVGTGTLAGIAGCSGGDSGDGSDGADDGGSGGDGDGREGDSVATLCADLSAEDSATYDAGETPLIANFDAPSPLVDEFGQHLPGRHRAVVDADRSQLRVDVGFVLSEEDQIDDEPIPRDNAPVVSEFEFNGEMIPVYGTPESVKGAGDSDRRISRSVDAGLPYIINGTKLYFSTNVFINLEGSDETIPEGCRETVEPTAVAIAGSLRLNEANTAEQYINDNWENPP